MSSPSKARLNDAADLVTSRGVEVAEKVVKRDSSLDNFKAFFEEVLLVFKAKNEQREHANGYPTRDQVYNELHFFVFVMKTSGFRCRFDRFVDRNSGSQLKPLFEFVVYELACRSHAVLLHNGLNAWGADLAEAYFRVKQGNFKLRTTYLEMEELLSASKCDEACEKSMDALILVMTFLARPGVCDDFHSPVHDPLHVCEWTDVCEYGRKIIKTNTTMRMRLKGPTDDTTLDKDVDRYEVVACEACGADMLQHPMQILINVLLKRVECLIRAGKFETATYTSMVALHHMLSASNSEGPGFFAFHDPETFSQLLEWFTDSVKPTRLFTAMCCLHNKYVNDYELLDPRVRFDNEIFIGRANILSELCEVFEHEDAFDREMSVSDFATAKIIVDNNGPRGYINGKFHVQDIESAIKIARPTDNIFLVPGEYMGSETIDDNGKKVHLLRISRPVRIIGSSTNRCVLKGTIVCEAKTETVYLKRLKIEIGESADSPERFFVYAGEVVVDNCWIAATANTAIFCHNTTTGPDSYCKLFIVSSFLDGQDMCMRFFSVLGREPVQIEVQSCIAKNMFSLISCIEPTVKKRIGLNCFDTVLMGVQDGFKFVVDEDSAITLNLVNTEVELLIMDIELTSHGVYANAGRLTMRNFAVVSHHPDMFGVSAHNLKSADISNGVVESQSEESGQLGISVGVEIDAVDSARIRNVRFSSMRVGLKLRDQAVGVNKEPESSQIVDCSFKHCSIGLLYDGQNTGPKIHSENTGRNAASLSTVLARLSFETCFYGYMHKQSPSTVSLRLPKFTDVPKALLINKMALGKAIEIFQPAFLYPRSTCSPELIDTFDDATFEELVRKPLYVEYAGMKNLALRVAYDHDEFYVVSSNRQLEELQLVMVTNALVLCKDGKKA